MRHVVKDQTHLLQSKISNLQEKVDRSQNQLSAIFLRTREYVDFMKKTNGLIHTLKYHDSINTWLKSVESTLDIHINAYQSTLDIIHDARRGSLHPQLPSKSQLQWGLQEINDVNKGCEFPIHTDHIRAEKLSEVVRVKIGHQSRRLIIEIYIPLLETRTYELYRMYLLPIPQHLSENKTISTFIVPRSMYIAVNKDKTTHTFLSESQLNACQKTDHLHICSHHDPTYEEHACELNLLIHPDNETLSICDVRYTGIHQTHWAHIPSING